MSSNRFFTGILLIAASGFFQACSADSSPSGEGTGAPDIGTMSGSKDPGTYGSTGTPPSSSSSSGSASSANTATSASGDPVTACISACEAKHPKGVLIGKGIDSCWSKSCPTECNGIGTGAAKPPAHGTCQNPVSTPSADCSQCTVDKCCTAWDACFDDTDCAALNACSVACYK
jgi:hypothetical protein